MNCHAAEVKSYKTIMFDMDAVEGENDLGEICFTLENKIDAIMNAHGSQGTGSVHQESHDIDESATPSSVISSQWGDKIVNGNEIRLQIRNTTNQMNQDEDGEIYYTSEYKINENMNEQGLQGTGSNHQESSDANESATPINVISTQWGDKIVDENGIQLQTRNTTNQIMQYKDGDTSFNSEYKVDIIANSHGSRGTDSIPQESHDVDESATTISVISSQQREEIVDKNGIQLQTRNTTNQTGKEEDGEDNYDQLYEYDYGSEQVNQETNDENPSNPSCCRFTHYRSNKYVVVGVGSFILGCGITAAMIFQYILGLILLGAFVFLATIYLCWFCVMKNGHGCCKKCGAYWAMFGALLFVCGLTVAIPWYYCYYCSYIPHILGVVGAIGGLGLITMYLCWMSMKKNSPIIPVTDV